MGRWLRTDAVAGTTERGIRRKVEGRSGMGGFLVGEGRDARTGGGGGEVKSVGQCVGLAANMWG